MATYVHGHECRRKVGGVADFPSRGRRTPTDIDSVYGGGGGCMETSRSWAWRAEADKRGCIATSCHFFGCGQDEDHGEVEGLR